MRRVRCARVVGSAFAAALFAGAVTAQTAGVASANGGDHLDHGRHGPPAALFVSPWGQTTNSGRSCATARYSTIQSAVNAATPGATVVVCPGTYNEDVIVSTPLSLQGRGAVIQGSATANGMCDQLGPNGPGSASCLAGVTIKSSHVAVSGFTVKKAIGEGILATGSLQGGSISDVTITDNHVVGNNTGGFPPDPNSPYPQCSESGQIPGDCGEGVHLMGVAGSRVTDNFISANEGGVLLTDEFGPTHDNLVDGNNITGNPFDCGITVPGHNPNALDKNGNRQPSVAGVYHNLIRHNWVTNNGLQGEGAGVLFANAGPGTGSYDNVVEGNYLAGNQLAGVTMHAHTLPPTPGMFEDLNGNRIVHNVIGKNNVGSAVAHGDPLDGPPAQDFDTTGIIVFSGTVPVQVTITGNRIVDNHFGVWIGVNGHATASLNANSFQHVDVPVFTFS